MQSRIEELTPDQLDDFVALKVRGVSMTSQKHELFVDPDVLSTRELVEAFQSPEDYTPLVGSRAVRSVALTPAPSAKEAVHA